MRARIHLLGVPVMTLALLATGCGDDTTVQDMAMTPDLAMAADLTMPQADLAPTFSGTVVLSEVTGVVPVPVDGGVMPVPAKLLSPSVGFGKSPGGKPDYNDIPATGLPIGCSGNHYDIAGGDLPDPDINAGAVKLSGYKEPTSLTGVKLPAEINCAFDAGKKIYACGYGPLNNGMPSMIDPGTAPYLSNFEALPKDAMVRLQGGGTDPFGTFDKSGIVAAGPIAATEDLNKLTFDPTKDLDINFSCPDGDAGSCGATGIVVSISAGQSATGPSTKFGAIRCAALAAAKKVTVKKGAIAAMLGCDAQGANCDTSIKVIRTIVLRVPLPGGDMDSKKNPMTLLAGHGVFGVSQR